ncbi:DNA sulfur modification protein DndB [Comamonas aquatica]|uniref:DNA sulfur modification protein DndB n=1 Tax=Comamonas aquatica TaxID=225991 RepID=UPI000AC3019F|nr:DNA sulfur modification protein DndB [Comamonas aquatica]
MRAQKKAVAKPPLKAIKKTQAPIQAKSRKLAPKDNSSATGFSSSKSILRRIFEGAGFKHVESDNLHFQVGGRAGEIDHIFVWENVVLLCEETTEAHPTKHCTNKIVFHGRIAADFDSFFTVFNSRSKSLLDAIGTSYGQHDLEVRHIYFSEMADIDMGSTEPFLILTRAQAKYFTSLVETIERSAKFELLKYLGIALHQTGQARISGSSVSLNSFPAFALPAAHTSYPPGFAVVSFYADPQALISRSYVLRRDGWEDPDLSYQRFVKAEKLVAMREYLADNGKVFINNLVVTLPSTAQLMDSKSMLPVAPEALSNKTLVQLQLPLELGTVGIVDGQHRILSYYEGSGATEAAIDRLRVRQNLLVTGIIFPPSYSAEMRAKFEAEIFLGINNNQSPVNPQLRQDLETIINPESSTAIARLIVIRLSKEGPLAGKMSMSQFDPPDKIASASLGPYVVESLTKPRSAFYQTWDNTGSRDLRNEIDREEFVNYSVDQLKRLLQGAASHLKHKWKSVPSGGILSTTVVGGFLLLMDRLVKNKMTPASIDYKKLFEDIDNFPFKNYSSSAWARLATDLMATLSIQSPELEPKSKPRVVKRSSL